MTKLTIHIGDPKTGTSSIQRALQNRLIECHSLSIAPWKQLNAIPLTNALLAKGISTQAARYGEVRDWLTECDADLVVISSELFARCQPEALRQALNAHLPDYAESVRVIAYVRPHHSRFLAAFVQRTKTGLYLKNFKDFLATIRQNDPLKYAERFGRWQEQFGDRFTLRPFIGSELCHGDVVADFFSEILDGAPFTLPEKVEENIAVPVQALAGMQLMHRTFRKMKIGAFGRSTIGGAMANYFLPAGELHGNRPELDRRTAETLIELYTGDAIRLDRMFFSAPLMQNSLEKCADKAVDTPIDLMPKRHFSPSQKTQLIALSEEIGKLLKSKRGLWIAYHRNRKDQIELPPDKLEKHALNRPYLDLVDNRFAELADIIRNGKHSG